MQLSGFRLLGLSPSAVRRSPAGVISLRDVGASSDTSPDVSTPAGRSTKHRPDDFMWHPSSRASEKRCPTETLSYR